MEYTSTIFLTTSGTTSLTATAPFTLIINPSGINCNNKIYKIYYDFGDNTQHTQTLFPANSTNFRSISGNYAFLTEPGDPRNFNQIKQYNTANLYQNYNIKISAYQINTSVAYPYTINLRLSSPYIVPTSGLGGGMFDDLHLISTRMYGLSNEIIYIFEAENANYFTNYVLPVSVNWRLRPQKQNIESIMNYRAYRLLEPYEDEKVTSINTVTHISTVGEVSAVANIDPA
jgi:hypothetical protein